MFSQRPAVRPTSGSRENITRPGFFRDFVAIACSGWRRRIILGRLEGIRTAFISHSIARALVNYLSLFEKICHHSKPWSHGPSECYGFDFVIESRRSIGKPPVDYDRSTPHLYEPNVSGESRPKSTVVAPSSARPRTGRALPEEVDPTLVLFKPVERHQCAVAPFLSQNDVRQVAPHILIGMVKHDDLQPIARSRDLLAQKCEDLPHRNYIFIAPSYRIGPTISGGPPRKIDLTGLIVNQKTGDRMKICRASVSAT